MIFSTSGTIAYAQSDKPTTPSTGEVEDKFVETDPPPVTRIIMYNSGLSQFIHEGSVTDNRRVGMNFSLHDIDDVLKSLVFEDKGGGVVRAVEYKPAPDNQDVAAEKLGPAMTLAQTLQKYRGEAVTITTTKGNQLQGNVLSVENRQSGDDFVETVTIANDDGFFSVPINEFASIQFDDEKLRDDFKLAMAGLSKSRVADAKKIELLFEGEDARDVAFSYNVDAPIWRMTYRLDLKPELSVMQGWAHIDNVTGVDWEEIELDLRSGRPQSFHVELFAPVLAERSSIGLSIFDIPADKALVPQYFGFDPPARLSGSDLGGQLAGGGAGNLFGAGGGMGGMGGDGPLSGGRPGRMDIQSGFRANAYSDRSNKMVRFQIADPVTLAAGRSAMVPVLSESLPVNLYSMFTLPGNTAELIATIRNKAATPLIPGPVSIYSDGDFLGDGVLERIEVGQISELVYGDDLSVSLKKKGLPVETRVTQVSLRKDGRVNVVRTTTNRTRFTLVNEDSLPRDFLLRVPVSKPQYSPAPSRMDGSLAVYELSCPAKADVELVFSEVEEESSPLVIRDVTEKTLATWKKNEVELEPRFLEVMAGFFQRDKEFKVEQLELQNLVEDRTKDWKLVETELSVAKKTVSDAENVRTEIKADQTRLINILKLLTPESERAEPYLKKLTQSEKDFEQASEQVERLSKIADNVQKKVDLANEQIQLAEKAVAEHAAAYRKRVTADEEALRQD
ncbi:MAG: hypothetical protein VYE64_02685 [Planctomycetota bacterium]|nr:hypothetical protein [Planctomycetota bacterium]